MLLQNDRSIAALITVICLALMVFCLIERQVRQALGPEQAIRGLYSNNHAVRQTGRMVLYHLASLTIRPDTATRPTPHPINRGVQPHLLELRASTKPDLASAPEWLRTRRGWSMSCGWADAIERHADGEDLLAVFFRLLDEYRAEA
ncbi:hypothetical protein [Streptomyces sp. NPDC004675]|uniref:hypothetical protein n=1 Tax=Streptomyces sp. NPDC004675 TaxID=3154286 RepID=UPI0033AC41D5